MQTAETTKHWPQIGRLSPRGRSVSSAPENIFTGPVTTVETSAAQRYGRKPNGTSDQGYRED